jgi:hypothetical protein
VTVRATNLAATVPAALIGGILGWTAARLLKQPALQSVLACLGAWSVGSVAATALWLIRPPADADVLAVAWHLPKLLVVLGLVGIVALVLHIGMGELAVIPSAALAWRPIVLGVAGAIAGFWGYPGGAGLGEPLR